MKSLKFRNSVVIGFAFAVAEPGEEAERNHNDANADPEFRLFSHSPTPYHAVQNQVDSITAKNVDLDFNRAKRTCPLALRPEVRASARCGHCERFVQTGDGTSDGGGVRIFQGERMALIQDQFAA